MLRYILQNIKANMRFQVIVTQLTCLWAAAQASGVRPVLSTALISVPRQVKNKIKTLKYEAKN